MADTLVKAVESLNVRSHTLQAHGQQPRFEALLSFITPGGFIRASGGSDAQNESLDGKPTSQEEDTEMTDVDDENSGVPTDDTPMEDDPSAWTQEPLGFKPLKIEGKQISFANYFGKEWDDRIMALHGVSPMAKPPGMLSDPHPWQLKGAAQAHMLCHSPFRDMICGDHMGCFSVVVCPASCCNQWLKEFKNNFDARHQLSVRLLDDSSITAHELLAAGHDVLIVTYEFLERNYRAHRDWPEKIKEFGPGSSKKPPRRPTMALFSEFWAHIDLDIKRLVVDECHRVKLEAGARHQALKKLRYHSILLLSGTFLANQWQDVAGLISFLKGHPFPTLADFRRTFTTFDYTGREVGPDEIRVRLLQKFLMAFTIARPATLLELPGHRYFRCRFQLNDDERHHVEHHTYLYSEAQKKAAGNRLRKGKGVAIEDLDDNPLYHAIRAQQYSLHTALVSVDETDPDYDPNATDTDPEYLARDKRDQAGESREDWLKTLEQDDHLVFHSNRVELFLELYAWLREKYPDEKMVVFSKYLRFLDIVSEAVKKRFGVKALRYDGTVSSTQREIVRRNFDACHPSVPLLLTGDAGGVGLNITAASIAVQLEVWWNRNAELQAYGRINRQGQTKQVKLIRLEAVNSEIDDIMRNVQKKKVTINSRLMAPLLRRHDQSPVIPKLPISSDLMPLDY